jgi:hypothetical protein
MDTRQNRQATNDQSRNVIAHPTHFAVDQTTGVAASKNLTFGGNQQTRQVTSRYLDVRYKFRSLLWQTDIFEIKAVQHKISKDYWMAGCLRKRGRGVYLGRKCTILPLDD